VKTAISLPDSAFERFRRHAARLGISRSEFFVRAAERWADELDDADLTEAIDSALREVGPGAPDDNAVFVRRAAASLFAGQQDDGPSARRPPMTTDPP
jgi:Ribbon-helix-helix protein, copG family